MIPYHYQLVHYIPDLLYGEFVVVGFLMWSPKDSLFKYYFTPNLNRAKDFFKAAPAYFGKTLTQGVKSLEMACAQIDPKRFEGLKDIAYALLPPNENALQLAPLKKAVTPDINTAYAQMVNHLEKYVKDKPNQRLSDEALKGSLKKAFRKHRVFGELKPVQIKLDNGLALEYEHAWKNGSWQLYQTASFDFSQPKRIEKKVFELTGQLGLLEHDVQKEVYKVHLVTALPKSQPDVAQLVQRSLNADYLKLKRVQVQQYTPEQIDALAQHTQSAIYKSRRD